MKRTSFAWAADAGHRLRTALHRLTFVALGGTLVAVGCVGEPLPRSHSTRDPANPDAPEVAMGSAPSALATTAPTGNAAASAMTAGDAGIIYTCRMHPEVQQSTPGHCPKCGMTLVPKKP